MKKLFSLLMCLLLTAALAAPALADVLWEPADDFYSEHYNECARSDEGFMAQSDTVLWKSPEDDTPAGTLTAGQTVRTPFTWTDSRGDEWGYVEFRVDDGWIQGWINLTHPDELPANGAGRTVGLVVTLVVAVIAVTAAIVIAVMLRHRKTDAD